MFKKAEFLLSVADATKLPRILDESGKEMIEIAFAGRSNVGKSSLINHLVQKKDLARVSSTPGKTQLINFFTIDDRFVLVDLPGYGFAKVSKKKREGWGDLIQGYLDARKQLKLIVLLIDVRHLPTKDDLSFAKWALHYQKPLLIVFTKADKLTRNQLQNQMKKNLQAIEEAIEKAPIADIPYSIKDPKARQILIKTLQEHVHGIH